LRRLAGSPRGRIFAVVVYEEKGEFAGIILLKQGCDGRGDGFGFVAGGDDGEDAGPDLRRCVKGGVVTERTQAPEGASSEGEIKPDEETQSSEQEGDRRHSLFCNGQRTFTTEGIGETEKKEGPARIHHRCEL
jgi:hypothetical protein